METRPLEPGRRWFQFRLAELLVLTTWLAASLGASALLELNSGGRAVALVGFLFLLVGLLLGRFSHGIVLAVALFAACALIEMVSSVGVGDGKMAVTVGIRVVDSRTKEPIESATVTLRDLAFEEGPAKNVPPLASFATDAAGEASIPVEMCVTVRDRTFCSSERVYFSERLCLTIMDRAHHTEKCVLARRLGETFPPKPSGVYRIEIEMNPMSQETTSAGGPDS